MLNRNKWRYSCMLAYTSPFKFSGFCSNAVDISVPLGCTSASLGDWCPVFEVAWWSHLLGSKRPWRRWKVHSSWTFQSLNMRPLPCLEILGANPASHVPHQYLIHLHFSHQFHIHVLPKFTGFSTFLPKMQIRFMRSPSYVCMSVLCTHTHTFVCMSIFKMLNPMDNSYPTVQYYASTTMPHFLMSYSQ